MIDINSIRRKILVHGKEMYDANLNRNVKELIGHDEVINSDQIHSIHNNVPLNTKYQPELENFRKWYSDHFPQYKRHEHRRHIVYFNDFDYDNVLQCISLIQVLDNTMIVYQRSGDISKMVDDVRFFIEIAKEFDIDIDSIRIIYGSFHTKIDENDN
jgi:hypothetical protein